MSPDGAVAEMASLVHELIGRDTPPTVTFDWGPCAPNPWSYQITAQLLPGGGRAWLPGKQVAVGVSGRF